MNTRKDPADVLLKLMLILSAMFVCVVIAFFIHTSILESQRNGGVSVTGSRPQVKATAAPKKFSGTTVLPEKYRYYKIAAINGDYLALTYDGGFSGPKGAILRMDGKVIDAPDKYGVTCTKIGDDKLMIAEFSSQDYSLTAFRCYDAKGKLVAKYNGKGLAENQDFSISRNGNYFITTGDHVSDMTTTFYTMQGKEICTIKGIAHEAFYDDGFALVTKKVIPYGDHDWTLIDKDGKEIQFTIAGNTEYAGRKPVDYVLNQHIDGGRMVSVRSMEFEDGSSVENRAAIIDMENRRLYLMESSLTAYDVYDNYVIRNNQVMDKFAQNVLFTVTGDMFGKYSNPSLQLTSDAEPYIAASFAEKAADGYVRSLAILDMKGNVVLEPMENINLYMPHSALISGEQIVYMGSGLIAVEHRFNETVEIPERYGSSYITQSVTRCGFIDLKGNTVIPFKYEDVSPFQNGYAILDSQYIVDTQGKIGVSVKELDAN